MHMFLCLHWVTLKIFIVLEQESCPSSAEWHECTVFPQCFAALFFRSAQLFHSAKPRLIPNNWLPKNWPRSLFLILRKETQPTILLCYSITLKNKNNNIKMSKINFECANVGLKHLLSGRLQRCVNRLMCTLFVKCSGHIQIKMLTGH